VARLAERLEARGAEVVRTREPGGSPGAEAIRTLVLGGAVDRWAPMTELLLMMAARDDHLRRTIEPALARGSWVVSDRFVDSSRVYQGVAGGLGIETVDRLHALALGGRRPDLTFVLDLDPAAGLARRRSEGQMQRFEGKDLAFHAAVRRGFLALAAQEPARFVVIDADRPVEIVADEVWRHVQGRGL
jgi:dTMP kinase